MFSVWKLFNDLGICWESPAAQGICTDFAKHLLHRKISFTGKNRFEREDVSVTETRWLVYSRETEQSSTSDGFFFPAVILSRYKREVSQQEEFQDSKAVKNEYNMSSFEVFWGFFLPSCQKGSLNPYSCFILCLTTAEVYGECGCGSSVEPLQRGAGLLYEQKEKPTDLSDVLWPVH